MLHRHSKSHVWDLELEALVPVEYVDELYSNHTAQNGHSSCSTEERDVVTIQVGMFVEVADSVPACRCKLASG